MVKIKKTQASKGKSVPKAQKGASVKKAQGSAPAKYVSPYKSEKTADSTQYFTDKKDDIFRAKSSLWHNYIPVTKDWRIDTARQNKMHRDYDQETIKATNDLNRQRAKGKPGFDKNGNPISYKQAKANASKKRDGGKVTKYNVPRDNAMADALDRQDGKGKYAPKNNEAINNKPMKSGGKVSKQLGSAKHTIGNMHFAKKKK